MTRVTVAASSPIAAQAGAAVASRGGNAVDAALAASLVSMVTDLGVMALGAGGFIAVWPPGGEPVAIDAYAEMPGRGLDRDRFGRGARQVGFDYGGWMHTYVGYGSIATPGILAGMELASRQYGALPWGDTVAPAIEWAERGFPLSAGAAEYLSYTHAAIFGWQPESYRLLHRPDGTPLQAGDVVHLPGLAESLRLIAAEGAGAFYTGDLGQRLAAEVQANGGLLAAADLAAYRALERPPIRLPFGDWEVATNPPPAIGGACLAALLLLLDRQPWREWNPASTRQLAQIQQAVLDYRRHSLDGVEGGAVAAEVRRLLEAAGSGDLLAGLKSSATIHTSAADCGGLACSLSASAGYGSGVAISGTGLWLNNTLGEVELHPHGWQDIPPGTRLASNMAPTLARHPRGALLAIGSPGASRITTAIAQVLFNFLRLGMPLAEAIAHPRLHVEGPSGTPAVAWEAGLPVGDLEGSLRRQFPQRSMYFGGVQAALWDPENGLSAAADSRRGGGVAFGGT